MPEEIRNFQLDHLEIKKKLRSVSQSAKGKMSWRDSPPEAKMDRGYPMYERVN